MMPRWEWNMWGMWVLKRLKYPPDLDIKTFATSFTIYVPEI